jgi:hypothetical protein
MKTRTALLIAGLALAGVACTAPAPDTLGVKSFDGKVTATTVAPAKTEVEPVAAPSTCDVVREAVLTGNQSDINAAMEALQADTTADATAREYAQTYLSDLTKDYSWAGGDAEKIRKSSLDSDVSLIRMSCSF